MSQKLGVTFASFADYELVMLNIYWIVIDILFAIVLPSGAPKKTVVDKKVSDKK